MTAPAYVALALVPGVGRARLEVLLGAFESPAAAFAAPMRQLVALPGMTRAAATAVQGTDPASGERVIARTERAGRLAGPVQPGDESAWRHPVRSAEEILIVCAGGRAGSFSAVLTGWGGKGSSRSVTLPIAQP